MIVTAYLIDFRSVASSLLKQAGLTYAERFVERCDGENHRAPRVPKDRRAWANTEETFRLRSKPHDIRQRWHRLVRAPHPCGNALTFERLLLGFPLVRIHEGAHHMKWRRRRARIE